MNVVRGSKVCGAISTWAICCVAFSLVRADAQPALTPASPAIPAAPATPAVPAPSPALQTSISQSASNGLSIAGLAQLLAGLQSQMQQTLPVLRAFNDSFDFLTIGSPIVTNTSSRTGANFSSNLGANFASASGQNLSSSLAAPTLSPPAGAALNAFGLPPDLGVSPVTGQTIRSLLVLENDLERILPTLSALNGGTNSPFGTGLTPGFAPGPVSSVFTLPSTIR